MKIRFYALKIVLLMAGVFIIQVFSDFFTELFVLNQYSWMQPWRFLTSIFLHGGLGHFLYNGLALALFGTFLEGVIGSRRFMLVFLSTGISANLISVNFYDSSLGASGAIYGVIGTLVILRPMMLVWAMGLPMPLFMAALIWAAGDLVGIFIPSNIGNIAHLSGMFIGIIIGFIYRDRFRQRKPPLLKNRAYLDEDYVRRWEDRHMKSNS